MWINGFYGFTLAVNIVQRTKALNKTKYVQGYVYTQILFISCNRRKKEKARAVEWTVHKHNVARAGLWSAQRAILNGLLQVAVLEQVFLIPWTGIFFRQSTRRAVYWCINCIWPFQDGSSQISRSDQATAIIWSAHICTKIRISHPIIPVLNTQILYEQECSQLERSPVQIWSMQMVKNQPHVNINCSSG